MRDQHYVPVGDGLPLWKAALISGVELQANCIAGLLSAAPLRPAAAWLDRLLLSLIALIASLIMVFFPPTAAALLALILAAGWMGVEQELFVRARLAVLAAPPLAGIGTAYLASGLADGTAGAPAAPPFPAQCRPRAGGRDRRDE